MFKDKIKLSLTLKIKDKEFKIPGGNIKNLHTMVFNYGFFCRLNFFVSAVKKPDELFSSFTTQDIINADFTIEPHYKSEKETIEPLTLHGIVMEKRISNEDIIEEVKKQNWAVTARKYEIIFADPAYALLKQHYPSDLLVEKKSMKQLIDDHKAGLNIKYDWDKVLNKKHDIIALALGNEENRPHHYKDRDLFDKDPKHASFYDFLMWYIAENNGVFSYDTAKNEYTISEKKANFQKDKAITVKRADVKKHRIKFPATIRHSVNVLNSYTEAAKIHHIDNEHKFADVRRDYIIRDPIPANVTQRIKLEKSKLIAEEEKLFLTFKRYPQTTFRTNDFISLYEDVYNKPLFTHGKFYKVIVIDFNAIAQKQNPLDDHNMEYTDYEVEMLAEAESKDEKVNNYPIFAIPQYPFHVEGKVLSEIGSDKEYTYQYELNPDTAIPQYKVQIPIWDNLHVVVPFEPIFMSGHTYCPLDKNAHVDVAFDVHSACIDKCLQWRDHAPMPLDSQGNQIRFGKNVNDYSSITHHYEDLNQIFEIKREHGKSKVRATMEKGRIVLEVGQREELEPKTIKVPNHVSKKGVVLPVKETPQKPEKSSAYKAGLAALVKSKAPPKTDWIEVLLYDSNNKPVENEDFKIKTANGTKKRGSTNDKGVGRITAIDPGDCKITFTNQDMDAWDMMSGQKVESTQARSSRVIKYTVEQGENLVDIAKKHNLPWETIWNHEKNADYQSIRKDPNILYPGDILYIPDLTTKEFTGGTNKKHMFKLKTKTKKISYKLLKKGQQRVNEPYILTIDEKNYSGTTDGQGSLEQEVPFEAKDGTIIFTSEDPNKKYSINFSYLNPVDEITGAQGRLKSLGYYEGEIDGKFGRLTEDALRSFQEKNKLNETGQIDQTTKDKLSAQYSA